MALVVYIARARWKPAGRKTGSGCGLVSKPGPSLLHQVCMYVLTFVYLRVYVIPYSYNVARWYNSKVVLIAFISE